jgi:hypothetical protein
MRMRMLTELEPPPSLKLYTFLDTKQFLRRLVIWCCQLPGQFSEWPSAFNHMYLNFLASGKFSHPAPMFEVLSTVSSHNRARQHRVGRVVTAFRTDFLKSFRANAAIILQNRLHASSVRKTPVCTVPTALPTCGSIGVI